jgi:hypothetical protein
MHPSTTFSEARLDVCEDIALVQPMCLLHGIPTAPPPSSRRG